MPRCSSNMVTAQKQQIPTNTLLINTTFQGKLNSHPLLLRHEIIDPKPLAHPFFPTVNISLAYGNPTASAYKP